MEPSIFDFIKEVGFPIAAACAGGYFVFLTMRFILNGVMDSVGRMRVSLVLSTTGCKP